ncbi:type III-B CRISPR module-associated protein Cmr5 [Sulfurovum sp.]|jgi:CRISPR-associated protein Cmr5|uniref:type III-B CRISPR module-associated protein Cmr5 n=1 Tax=Sulfurovum sp. TaxID=1969726 RepID=UPI002A371D13|nr:type III-B CRISPR module-associated protein Cmr5 [Sulfurovum sp.]MDY0403680.1 type III-B CRISPR module-associated protein Cmr5 [Sulfurovum sp.]
MRKQIETYIPKAMEAIVQTGISNEQGEVSKQFNGYIASFGASIRSAGLLATVLFYQNEQSKSEKDRTKVVKAIEYIIGHSIIEDGYVSKDTRAKVEDAAVALKLSIRTFKLV